MLGARSHQPKPPTQATEAVNPDGLYKTNSGDALIEVFLSAEDIDFDAEELNINIAAIEARHADGVFFSRDDEFGACCFCIVDEVDEFLLTVAMVIRIVAFENEISAEVFKESFEAGGICDGRDGGYFESLQCFERMSVSAVEYFFQVLRFMTAFDDFGAVIMFPDELFEVAQTGRSVGFCEEDIIGAENVLDGFPHESAGENVMVVERCGGIDENDIDVCFEPEVLEAVVEDEDVRSEFVDGVESGFDAVLVDENRDIFEV